MSTQSAEKSKKFAWAKYYQKKEEYDNIKIHYKILLERYEQKCIELEKLKNNIPKQTSNVEQESNEKHLNDKIRRLENVVAELIDGIDNESSIVQKLKKALNNMVGL